MPKKKPAKQELGIPTFKQNNNLENIKNLARISQAHRVLQAAGLDEYCKHDKQTQTEQEDHVEAEIVDNLDIAEVVLHEVVPQPGNAPELNRHSWIITGIVLALWIRLLL